MKLAKTHIHFYGNKSSKSRFSDSSWCHFICSNNYIVTRESLAITLSREDAGSVSQRSMKEKVSTERSQRPLMYLEIKNKIKSGMNVILQERQYHMAVPVIVLRKENVMLRL